MQIKNYSGKPMVVELLADLAARQESGGGISSSEVSSILSSLRADLKDEFEFSDRGLDEATKAIGNTFSLAMNSGWVNSSVAAAMIDEFLTGASESDLDGIVADLRGQDSSSSRRTYSTSSSSSSSAMTLNPAAMWGAMFGPFNPFFSISVERPTPTPHDPDNT